jgi:hypothetical protein
MKKTLFFASLMLLSTALFFTACTEEENPDLPPGISFVPGEGLLTSDATVIVNDTFKIKVLCEPNTTSGSIIKTLKVTRISNNQIIGENTFNADNSPYIITISFEAMSEPGLERIEFTTSDKDGQSATIDIEITTEAASGGEIDTFTMKMLGSYQSPTGSSFASIDGTVYTTAEAFANQTIIDFLYWYGASTQATIGAPDDDLAQQVYTGANGLPNWTVKNGTRFKTTALTAAEFDAVADAAVCIDNATGADQTRIGTLAINNVFAFIAVTGKHGLIKVVAINEGAAGDITIDVKVEK